MNNDNFQKLTQEEKWIEKDKDWVKSNREYYVRLLITNNDLELLKKYENELIDFDFTYKFKDEILLTLAMEKNSYDIINYFIEKGLSIKERDIVALVKNYRKDENKDNFIDILEKIDFNKINFNKIITLLKDYFYDDNLGEFLNYGLSLNLEIEKNIIENLNNNQTFSFIINKHNKRKEYEKMNNRFPNKTIGKLKKL